MTVAAPPRHYLKALLWGSALIVGALLSRFAAQELQLNGAGFRLLLASPILLIIPFMRSMQLAEAAAGFNSPARGQFNRRCLVFGLAYAALWIAAIALKQRIEPGSAAIWPIALMPAVPIGLLGWAARRYLVEETDEFLRDSFMTMALSGTGVLILSATCWGFLAGFGVVEPADATLALPVWALGALLGDLYCRWKGR